MECDQYLMDNLKKNAQPERYIRYLLLADRYMLADTLDFAVDQLSCLSTDELKRVKHYNDLNKDTLCLIMHRRLKTT